MTAWEKVLAAIGVTVVTLGVVLLISVLVAFPIKWCWNYTMPYLFHLPEIGALQGFCLAFLGGCFFKSRTELKCKHD